MRIGEVVRRAGIPASTLRYYESRGLIPSPLRVGGKRNYDPSVLNVLAVIELAKLAGFSIAEIHRLLRGFSRRTKPGRRWRQLAERKLEEVEERAKQLQLMRRVLQAVLECECPSFDDCATVIESRR